MWNLVKEIIKSEDILSLLAVSTAYSVDNITQRLHKEARLHYENKAKCVLKYYERKVKTTLKKDFDEDEKVLDRTLKNGTWKSWMRGRGIW